MSRAEYFKQYNKKRINYLREYQRKNIKHTFTYIGSVTCFKCGKNGYKLYRHVMNIKTLKKWHYTIVRHEHKEFGKTVLDKLCYIGKGKI